MLPDSYAEFPMNKDMNTKTKNINQSSLEYQNKIKKYFKNKKISFDICLLGMGNDGHVASIFPNTNLLKKKFIVSPIDRRDFKRITIGLKILRRGYNTHEIG